MASDFELVRHEAAALAELEANLLARMAIAGEVMKVEAVAALSGEGGINERTGALLSAIEVAVDKDPLQPGVALHVRDPEQRMILASLEKGYDGTDRRGRNVVRQPRAGLTLAAQWLQRVTLSILGIDEPMIGFGPPSGSEEE